MRALTLHLTTLEAAVTLHASHRSAPEREQGLSQPAHSMSNTQRRLEVVYKRYLNVFKRISDVPVVYASPEAVRMYAPRPFLCYKGSCSGSAAMLLIKVDFTAACELITYRT